MIIQIILIVAALCVIVYALGQRNTHSGKAWKKIALSLLGVCMVVAVLFPDLTNQFAHIFGVGRGADLLLYLLVVAFIFYALNGYLQQQTQRDKMYRLARKIAVLEAKEHYATQRKK